jgi:hypothetical protein
MSKEYIEKLVKELGISFDEVLYEIESLQTMQVSS